MIVCVNGNQIFGFNPNFDVNINSLGNCNIGLNIIINEFCFAAKFVFVKNLFARPYVANNRVTECRFRSGIFFEPVVCSSLENDI